MNMGHVNDCLVCGKPLLYFEAPRKLECVFCHQTFLIQAACEDGHYVCDACHSAQGIKAIWEYCETAVSTPLFVNLPATTTSALASVVRIVSGEIKTRYKRRRTTGDGYYESCILAFEGNQIELTV